MDTLKVFDNPAFGRVRALTLNGEPWFVGKDVASVLGYKDTVNALKAHVDGEDKRGWQIATPSGTQTSTVINESGLYSLILSSKLPAAKEFKRWITSEVLPAIRKTGGYIHGAEDMTDAELLAQAVLVANRTIAARDERIRELEAQAEANAPAVLFAGAVSVSNEAILIGELAKILKQNGVPNMGQNRLFERLRGEHYLISRKGTDYNMPTQRAMEMGLFVIKETAITHSDGHVTVSKTVKVTGKGQIYFINHFLGKKEAAS